MVIVIEIYKTKSNKWKKFYFKKVMSFEEVKFKCKL